MSVEIILIGPGLVGSAVLQLLDGYSKLRPVIVTRVVSSKISYTHTNTSRSISDLDDASIIKEHRPAAQIDPRLLHPQPSGSYRSIIMVDCTSSADVVAMYEDWLSHGDCHIVTANKKGISSEWELYSRLMNLSTCEIPSHNLFLFEASVGAGLPVISTIKDLVMTGDVVVGVVGVLSGTLSYLFNEFSSPHSSQSFSEILVKAMEQGFTEPDPRDDLNGLDVARKIVILARVSGYKLSLEEVEVESLIPQTMLDLSTPEFLRQFPTQNGIFAQKKMASAEAGNVLRYVASFTVGEHPGTIINAKVSLNSVPQSSPLGSLKSSDNCLVIKTKRFPRGIVIQGAGAGAGVTAHGVVSDIHRIVESVAYSRG